MGQEAAAHQPMSPNLLGTALRNAAAMHACTMEQLPMGPTAFNSCTLEQLPTGTALPSPAAAASPVLGRSGSPVVIAHSMLAEQKPGQGQGLHAAGLCARNAAAALCSARQQGVEPCNAYRCAATCDLHVPLLHSRDVVKHAPGLTSDSCDNLFGEEMRQISGS